MKRVVSMVLCAAAVTIWACGGTPAGPKKLRFVLIPKVVETYDTREAGVRCSELIATGTNRYPSLGVWISVGGWPVFTANALNPVNPKKTKFISFDTNPPAPDLLKAGKVQVLLGQKYF